MVGMVRPRAFLSLITVTVGSKLAACEIYRPVTTANISVNRMARRMEGKIEKYAGGREIDR
jgi:hypothetical protein